MGTTGKSSGTVKLSAINQVKICTNQARKGSKVFMSGGNRAKVDREKTTKMPALIPFLPTSGPSIVAELVANPP